MVSKQDWKTWLRTTLFVAVAAFLAVGFTFATHSTAAADNIPCAAPAWVTEDSHIPFDTVDVVCALSSSASAGSVEAPAASFETDSGVYFEAYLKALEQTERDSTAAFGSTTSPSFDQTSGEYISTMENHAMSEGRDVTTITTSPSFDRTSGEYILMMENHAMSEGQ